MASTMYLGLDGTGVPMRASEVEGRNGKQPDGSAKTREVKLVTVWTAEGRDKQAVPVRDPGSVSYSAGLESAASRDTDDTPSEFARRADREAHRRGFDRAKRRVVLGDGAPWIWNLTEELFPGAIQIVDLYHAKGHLWDVAKAIYGAGSDLCEHWAKRLKRAGMHWTLAGADAIIALRCCKLSGRLEDFWRRRSAAPAGAPVEAISQI